MIKGQCHCKKVSWTFEGEIERVTACNCTVCRKYGTLWAYGYKDENIKIEGPTNIYFRGRGHLGFHFCTECGCTTHWLSQKANEEGKFRIAVNTRLASEPEQIQDIPIRHFDGLEKFTEASLDDKCVRDLWF